MSIFAGWALAGVVAAVIARVLLRRADEIGIEAMLLVSVPVAACVGVLDYWLGVTASQALISQQVLVGIGAFSVLIGFRAYYLR